MVTGKSALRREMAKIAIDSFLAQSYTAKELIIINHGKSLDVYQPGVEEVLVQKSTLGELRNQALQRAKGKWICQWDDDDYSHMHRLALQMAHRSRGCCVLPRYCVAYHVRMNHARIIRDDEGHGGLILHPRTGRKYRSDMNIGEDTEFWTRSFGDSRILWDNDPDGFPGPSVYVRIYHEDNTTPEQMAMRGNLSEEHKNRWNLPNAHKNYLQQVLEKYGLETSKEPTRNG